MGLDSPLEQPLRLPNRHVAGNLLAFLEQELECISHARGGGGSPLLHSEC